MKAPKPQPVPLTPPPRISIDDLARRLSASRARRGTMQGSGDAR